MIRPGSCPRCYRRLTGVSKTPRLVPCRSSFIPAQGRSGGFLKKGRKPARVQRRADDKRPHYRSAPRSEAAGA